MKAVKIKTAYGRKSGEKITEDKVGEEVLEVDWEIQVVERLLNGFLMNSQYNIPMIETSGKEV